MVSVGEGKKKSRPTIDSWMKQKQVQANREQGEIGYKLAEGPAVDTAATTSVATVQDSKKMQNLEKLKQPVKFSGVGKGEATHTGDLQVGLMEIKGMKVMEGVPMSVVAANDLYREGWLLVAGKGAAVLVRPGEEDADWDSI